MRRLIQIADIEKYDEFRVEVNSKLEVIYGKIKYKLTEDDIVLPGDGIGGGKGMVNEEATLSTTRSTPLANSKPLNLKRPIGSMIQP